MMDKRIQNNPHILYNKPIEPLGKKQSGQKLNKRKITDHTLPFAEVLKQQLRTSEIKFSGHALSRMERRKIILTSDQVDKLNSAVEKAAQKGARDSLILIDSLAFVVSIKNRTVITAIDGEQMKENVFTNIDSAVIT